MRWSWWVLFRISWLSLLMSACQPQESEDLHRWMNDVRQRLHVSPITVPTIAPPPEFRYQAADRADPFDLARLALNEASLAHNALQPDLRRPREPLERVPLDGLRLIGHLRRGKEAIALIQADKLVYSVRVGAHLGLDLGKLITIHDKAIDIEEWVADSTGQWTRRQTQLVLREKK